MGVSEWSMPIELGGVKTEIGEYSISVVGPGRRAKRNWGLAKQAGIRTMAKTQFNNTWEISAVPYIPAVHLIARHCSNLVKAGVSGLQESWTLGGYPSPNLDVAREFCFSPGDTIEGLLHLELTEPLEGSRLVVGVDARQRIVAPVTGEGSAIRRAVLWRVEKALVKATSFESLRKRFSLKLPEGLAPKVPANAATLGLVGAGGRSAARPLPLEWSVFAYLERPWASASKARVIADGSFGASGSVTCLSTMPSRRSRCCSVVIMRG